MTKTFTPKIGPKGQMTLPKEVRAFLELEEGDRVLLEIQPDGRVVLAKAIIVAADWSMADTKVTGRGSR